MMRALFSLCDTAGVVQYARTLLERGWQIVASRETSTLLHQEGLACTDVAEFTGFGENLGFPPTLHPRIEQALTDPQAPNRIDLVYDIPYSPENGLDIGGHTLLALALKGNRIPVASRADMNDLTELLCVSDSESPALRAMIEDLQKKARERLAEFYSRYSRLSDPTGREHQPEAWSPVYELANGENPYQRAILLRPQVNEQTERVLADPLGIPSLKLVSATPPCFTNLADTDALLQTLCLAASAFGERREQIPFIAAASKHGNACGLAISRHSPRETIAGALWGDPIAVWGGELITNFAIDEACADMLIRDPRRQQKLGSAEWMLDVAIAPEYSSGALGQLKERTFRKIFQNPAFLNPVLQTSGTSRRWVRGGLLEQTPPSRVLRWSECRLLGGFLTREEEDDLILAWAVAYSSFHGGNEIALAKERCLLGCGGGAATLYAARRAVQIARDNDHDTRGAVFVADAFFPFIDAPEVLVNAGVRLGAFPAGGRNESLVLETFARAGVKLVLLPADFRGFCRH
jgi:phosphoribosylaminoimidazolecarboxamide formyltransferase/IMP cyclohydrolase